MQRTEPTVDIFLPLPGSPAWKITGREGARPTGFAQLAKHRLLSGFYFQGNIQLNDSAIATIRDFPRLAHLMLPFCGVTDAGVRNLAIADRFFTLSLDGNSITDDSVPHLCRLKSLRRLWVGKTSISSFGYDELKAALPRCRTLNDVL
ncbi:hypothetical protein [Rhodopirellula baltica]|uniref:hypothetical protein n=1 Tax=Rhodopirellula baltica TaxID=265606 RepID=UPI001147A637|nr:hypothetical protein [Rhodopirellula baltica]